MNWFRWIVRCEIFLCVCEYFFVDCSFGSSTMFFHHLLRFLSFFPEILFFSFMLHHSLLLFWSLVLCFLPFIAYYWCRAAWIRGYFVNFSFLCPTACIFCSYFISFSLFFSLLFFGVVAVVVFWPILGGPQRYNWNFVFACSLCRFS